MNFSWDLVRTFEAVARTGSLSAAARDLKLSQPTVGRHIDLIEDQFRMALFIRGREGMQLTEQGADLVASAHELKLSALAFERSAAGADENISGTVRISANDIFGVLVLPHLLADFIHENPDVQVEIAVNNSAANLLQRDADIAVRMFRPTQNDLVARKISNLKLGLYAHKDYLTRHPPPQNLAELRNHNFIGFDRETSLIEVAAGLGEVFEVKDFVLRSDNILTHIEAVRAGVGVGVIQQKLAESWPEVRRVLPFVSLPDLELWIACHSEVRHNKRIRMMMDFLAGKLGDWVRNTPTS